MDHQTTGPAGSEAGLSPRWFEIALPVPAELMDEAAALLDFAGFSGVEIRDRAEPCEVVVVVAVDDADQAETRARDAHEAVEILGAGEPRIRELDPKLWTENWKRHFARKTFAQRIEVYPPWEAPSPAASGLLSIMINPGMAFGTGLHETTAGCLELLVEEVRPGMKVADVGCGSGILAIAAARLGAASVLATDVDPLAVDAANENVLANGASEVVQVELEAGEVGAAEWEVDARPGLAAARDSVTSVAPAAATTMHSKPEVEPGTGFAGAEPGSFDLIVANILAETLVEMHDMFASALRPGGTLVVSGIEARRLKMVEEAFIDPPWCLARTVRKGDWISLSLRDCRLGRTRAEA